MISRLRCHTNNTQSEALSNKKVSIFEPSKDFPAKRRSKRPSKRERETIGRENRDKLKPMAFPMFLVKRDSMQPDSPSYEWFSKTLEAIADSPWKLTDKWISKINEITDDWVRSAMLEPPVLEEGYRGSLGPYRVLKIVPPKDRDAYPTPAIIAIDHRGWKWYFKTTKAYSFKDNDVISFVATISSHKEGISFLKRPSKIALVEIKN
jgi:hypothetical protein